MNRYNCWWIAKDFYCRWSRIYWSCLANKSNAKV